MVPLGPWAVAAAAMAVWVSGAGLIWHPVATAGRARAVSPPAASAAPSGCLAVTTTDCAHMHVTDCVVPACNLLACAAAGRGLPPGVALAPARHPPCAPSSVLPGPPQVRMARGSGPAAPLGCGSAPVRECFSRSRFDTTATKPTTPHPPPPHHWQDVPPQANVLGI